jgi:hypothetical protein
MVEQSMESEAEARYKSAFDLVALALAGGVTVLTSDGSFTLFDVMIGAVLLILLSTRDTAAMPARAYRAVWALLWVITLGFPLDFALLALSRGELRVFLDAVGGWLRRAGYLPRIRATDNSDWLAAYNLMFTTAGFIIWYLLAGVATHRTEREVPTLLWWRKDDGAVGGSEE